MSATPIFLFLPLLVLLLLFAAGVALIVISRRKGSPFPACGQCGYNVSASIGTTTRCPECGGEFGEVGITPTRARTNRHMLLTGVALLLVPAIIIGIGMTSAAAARREAARAQAAAAQAAAAQATAATIAFPIPPPITQQQVDAMSDAELRQALMSVSRARQAAAKDPVLAERLRSEFVMLMDRLRTVKDAQTN